MFNLGDYEVLERLGKGASGFVYKAKKDSQLYAVKACIGFSEEARKRFDREIRLASALSHPHIIKVYDYDMTATNPYFVMDLCEGTITRCLASYPIQNYVPWLAS